MMQHTTYQQAVSSQPAANGGAAACWAREAARARPDYLALVESPVDAESDGAAESDTATAAVGAPQAALVCQPDQPFGVCHVPSCAESARVLDAESHGRRTLCVRCGRTQPLAAHVVREATRPRILALAIVGACAAATGGLLLAFAPPTLPVVLALVVGLTMLLGAATRWLALVAAHAVRLRRHLRWETSWQVDEQALPGWGVRQAALLGLLRDLRIGDTRSLEDVVWKAQRDAEDAVREAWIAPHDPETGQHLGRVRRFGPYMDAVVRSFIARLSRNPPVETEVYALVEALREAMDG